MGTQVLETRAGSLVRLSGAAHEQLRWLAGGLALAFLLPFVLSDRLGLPRDPYYGIYAAAVGALFVLWVRATRQSLGSVFLRRWSAALALGLAFAALLAVFVVRAEEATSRPDGLELVAAVLWRGVVYGLADGLLLSAFPILVVFAAFRGTRLRNRLAGTVAIGLVALVASLAMTAAYHAGYSDFRSTKLASPVGGDVAWSIPTLVTLNPLGAPVAHAGLHVGAVLHSYETDLFLPPHE